MAPAIQPGRPTDDTPPDGTPGEAVEDVSFLFLGPIRTARSPADAAPPIHPSGCRFTDSANRLRKSSSRTNPENSHARPRRLSRTACRRRIRSCWEVFMIPGYCGCRSARDFRDPCAIPRMLTQTVGEEIASAGWKKESPSGRDGSILRQRERRAIPN